MQRDSSSSEVILGAVKTLSRKMGGGRVDVSLVASFTGRSNTEVAESISRLQDLDAPVRLNTDETVEILSDKTVEV